MFGGYCSFGSLSAAAADAPPLILEHLTPSEGMPQSTVMTTLQDSQGFVWLGTEDGLVRYDGHELVRYAYSRNATNGLPGNFIWQIIEDAHHDLWIAMKDAGVARWNRATDSFTVFRHDQNNANSLASDAARALLIDDRGRVWVGNSEAGIDVIDSASGHIEHWRHDSTVPGSLSDDQIFTLSRDRSGAIRIGTAHGLDQFQVDARAFRHVGREPGEAALSGTQISKVIEDQQHNLWVGSFDGGLNRMDPTGRVTTYRHSEADATSLASDDVRALLEDRTGRIWVGTPDGLDLLDAASGSFTHFRHEEGDSDSLRDSFIMSLYEDPAGLIWIGTRAGGVSRWNPRSWELGGHRPSWLVGKLVTTFADAADRKIWVGSYGGGLVRFDPETGDALNLDDIVGRRNALGDQRVMALRTGQDGTVWIGTMKNGLKKLTANGQLTSIPVKAGDAGSTSSAGIMTIVESRGGEIWLGTHGGGLNVLDPKTGVIRQLPHSANMPGATSHDSVTAIAEEASGMLWLGTDGGGLDLARPDGTVVKVFKHDPNNATSMPSDTIYAVTVDSTGGVWVATEKGGIARIAGSSASPDSIRFEPMSLEEGLSSDTIYGLLMDAAGQIWMSGNSGLMRLDPASLRIKTFHREHGLQGEEFDTNAYLRLGDGRLCFGGPGGFNVFDPSRLTDNEHAPRVVLTRMEVLGAPVPSTTPYWLLNRVAVDHRASIVSLDFGALDFTSPKRNRLQYRVKGLSDQWIDLGAQHRITLTNLDAGDHLLEVRAANADSVWSDPALKLIVHRDPAPWRSPWAYAAYAVLLLLLIAYRIRLSRAKIEQIVQAKERLEADVAVRTRELSESNRRLEESNRQLADASQAKSSFLARMSHELRTPMNGVVGSTELLARTAQSSAQKLLTDTIRSSANVLLQIVNDLLDFAKVQAGKLVIEQVPLDLNLILEECTTLFAGAAAKKNIELIVWPAQRGAGELLGDPLRVRQILMNLVGNAVKFTEHGEVVIKASLQADAAHREQVHLEVADTGIGMSSKVIEHIFEPFTQADESTTRRYGGSGLGLAICRELSERLGGQITVKSSPGNGSTFQVTLPMVAASVTRQPADASQGAVRILTSRPSLRESLSRQLKIIGYQWAEENQDEDIDSAADATIVDFATHRAAIERLLASDSLAPVVVLAFSTEIETLQSQYSENRVVLVHKPVQCEKLRDALRAVRTESRELSDTGTRAAISAHLNGRVLLVEDEPVNAFVAQGYLAELGCSSVWVVSGMEAVSRIENERFDLIMMDLNMPVLDGFATTKLIRQQESPSRRTPIVALTAHDAKQYREMCLQAGMDGLLSKPYTFAECEQLLRRWLAPGPSRLGDRSTQAREESWSGLCAIDEPTVAGLRKMRGDGSYTLYGKLVEAFLRSSAEAVKQLNQALDAGDFPAAAAVCHRLAAAASNVGALAFGRETKLLEKTCAAGDAQTARRIYGRMTAAYAALCDELSLQTAPGKRMNDLIVQRIAIIADDEELGRMLLADTASESGLTPLAFDNGAAALQAALTHEVAIVLLDVDMPGLDGYAVCRRLRQEPRFASTPIVMVTGHEDSAAISLAFEAGATEFISKPVNWILLPRRLAYILRNAAAAERIEKLAYFDTLTGLPNRERCLDTAARYFSEAEALNEQVAIIYLDLNGFKRINDTFGHAIGDAVLGQIALQLGGMAARFELTYGRVFLSRFGGDEFVLLVSHRDAPTVANEMAQNCLAALKAPISRDGLEFYTAPSIGVAFYPGDGKDVATVLKHADTAMYRGKSGAFGSVVTYNAAMSVQLREWLDLESRLRRAVHDDRLYLHYQPKFRLSDNRLVGVEALLRWWDPEHGQIPPTRFIEIAEDSGLILELGSWVVRAACRQLRQWQDRGWTIPIAINVSANELLHGDPARVVEEEAAAAGVPTGLIEIEITESLMVKDSDTVQSALERMRRLGCRIALDDFGTGYSSLAYITRFPPDRIKIDKAFVRNIDRAASDGAVANAILSLAKSLGVTVTAEGIERYGQLEWLRSRGCHEAQGFLMSMPLSARDLEIKFLESETLDIEQTFLGPALVIGRR